MFERGFLPPVDPLFNLPEYYRELELLGADLPKLIVNCKTRERVKDFRMPDVPQNEDLRTLERLFVTLTFVTHAYVFETVPVDRIPENLAKPLVLVANMLGRNPVLSYASYALHNWRRLNPDEGISLSNLALIQNFLGGQDEDWFVMIHIVIEQQAAPAIQMIDKWLRGSAEVPQVLESIFRSLNDMNTTLNRMPEKCDPYIYYNRVRPYIFGWKNNPALPNGLLYEGVWPEPKLFRGETGAQSTIIPTFDAFLGVHHADDPLKTYLLEMREYMPREHRAFLEQVENKGSCREFVINSDKSVKELYNECIYELEKFRTKHLEYAHTYIFNQAQTSQANSNKVGTGGTPFTEYLKKHRDETLEAVV